MIGMMGSGKSAAGKLLAQQMERPFHDCDYILSQRAGYSIAEYFKIHSEAKFRETEHELLAELLRDDRPCVIATGGGVVLDKRNRHILKSSAHCLFLKAPANILADRIKSEQDMNARPLLAQPGVDMQARIAELLDKRMSLYEQTADYVLNTEGLKLAQTVDSLQSWCQKFNRNSDTG
jgi:shikimate kinase